MSRSAAKISFRFLNGEGSPGSLTREFTQQNLQVPEGGHIPRVGEIVELTHWDSHRDIQVASYVVLSVFTRMALFDGNSITNAWHTTLTVAEPSADIDGRFLTLS